MPISDPEKEPCIFSALESPGVYDIEIFKVAELALQTLGNTVLPCLKDKDAQKAVIEILLSATRDAVLRYRKDRGMGGVDRSVILFADHGFSLGNTLPKSSSSSKAKIEEKFQLLRRIMELNLMPYKEYLETPEWHERRDRAKTIAGNKCQLCGAKGPVDVALNVHHNSYEHLGFEPDEDLIVLCECCHQKFHDIEDE